MSHVIFIFLLYRRLVDKGRQQVNFLLSNIFRVFLGGWGWGGGTQSSTEASLCLREARERKNESGWGEMDGKGKKILLFPLAITYYVLTIFELLPFFIGIPRVCLCGGERRWNYAVCR